MVDEEEAVGIVFALNCAKPRVIFDPEGVLPIRLEEVGLPHIRADASRRRRLIRFAITPLAPGLSAYAQATPPKTRLRPGDPGWPSAEKWDQLKGEVEGRLLKVSSPLAA
jgi:hypothetical protein